MIALLSLAFAADLPTLEVTWNRDLGHVTIVAPEGQHVAPDSNVELMLEYGGRTVTHAFPSELGHDPIAASDLRGQDLIGSLRAPICKDDGTECRMLSVNVAGSVPDIKRGSLQLDSAPPEAPVAAADSPFHRDAREEVAAAMAQAAATDRPVLLDFSAVWCPPCNLLGAEVLHAPDSEMTLSDVLVVIIDVDEPSSWELKDRYDVGGYPTVVAVDAEGNEIDRLLGYDSRESTLSWINDVSDGQATSRIPEAGPEDVTPEQAAQAALTLIERGDDGYEPWLERALTEPEMAPARVARMLSEPNADDAQWLLDNAPQTTPDWVFATRGLPDHQALRQRAAWEAVSRSDDGIAKADFMFLMAEASESPAAEALYAGAASTLRTAFVGEPGTDRAHVTFLATLHSRAHDVDGALDLLNEYEGYFPEEPTWAMKAASLLLAEERHEDALAHADRAVELAWGDNLLRAAKTRAEILLGLGRDGDARAYVEQVLAEQPEPEEGARVRTPRYREALREVVAADDDE